MCFRILHAHRTFSDFPAAQVPACSGLANTLEWGKVTARSRIIAPVEIDVIFNVLYQVIPIL